jgi:V/A-type H+-transporting ATPase subunit D
MMIGRLRVPPTRSALLKLRKRRAVLTAAAGLLERKRRVLAQEALELLPRWERLRRQADSELERACRSFVVTRMGSTAADLRQLVGGMSPLVSAGVTRRSLAGVPLFAARPHALPLRPRFGLLGSTAELDRTIALLVEATRLLVELAACETSLRILVDPGVRGVLTEVSPAGTYGIGTALARVEDAGHEHARVLAMFHRWPVRAPRPVARRSPNLRAALRGHLTVRIASSRGRSGAPCPVEVHVPERSRRARLAFRDLRPRKGRAHGKEQGP